MSRIGQIGSDYVGHVVRVQEGPFVFRSEGPFPRELDIPSSLGEMAPLNVRLRLRVTLELHDAPAPGAPMRAPIDPRLRIAAVRGAAAVNAPERPPDLDDLLRNLPALTLECPCCGCEGATPDAMGWFTDGQPLVCGCAGWVSVGEDDVWINNGDDECPADAKCRKAQPAKTG